VKRSDINRSRRIFRSIGAVVVGFLVIVVLSLATDALMHATGIYPPWFQYMSDSLFVLATAYRCVYSVLGCYLAARLAPGRPMLHALVLGLVGFVLSIAGAAATWNQGRELGPRWYPLTLVAISIPLAWVGGKIRLMQLRAKQNQA